MTYSESAEGIEITRERALQELRDHGIDNIEQLQDFDYQLGIRNYYMASEVLHWLGY